MFTTSLHTHVNTQTFLASNLFHAKMEPWNNIYDENDARPKFMFGIPIPWQARRKFSQKKLQRNLNVSVNFIVLYDNKKLSYFSSNKDKVLNLYKSKVVCEINCPGCCKPNDTYRNTKTKVQFDISFTTVNTCNTS